MARNAPGQIVERKRGRDTVFAIRFRAYGQRHYESLGYKSEGWTRRRAEQELQNRLADVRRGIWRPPEPEQETEPPKREPTFHEFASEWLEGRIGDGLAPRSVENLRWSLEVHLLPHFASMPLSAITVQEVDRYRRAKVTESERRRYAIVAGRPLRGANGRVLWPLSPSSINATLKHLSSVLEQAREYELIPSNPATGRRRRLRAPDAPRVHLDRAERIAALLDAAAELDQESRTNRDRRALLATLVFAGLRISEALALRWRDVDLAAGRLHVRKSKTPAGIRDVPLLPVLRDELAARKAAARPEPGELVFTTRDGGSRDRNSARARMLRPAVELANKRLEENGGSPLPDGLTLHGLRHTYVSLRLAIGDDIATVSRDAGHKSPLITAGVYTHVMESLNEGEREALRALVEGRDWAPAGTKAESGHSEPERPEPVFGSTLRAPGGSAAH